MNRRLPTVAAALARSPGLGRWAGPGRRGRVIRTRLRARSADRQARRGPGERTSTCPPGRSARGGNRAASQSRGPLRRSQLRRDRVGSGRAEHRSPSRNRQGLLPNDPGPIAGSPGPPGDWVAKQWNFLPWEGTASSPASGLARRHRRPGRLGTPRSAGRPGAKGVTVAVLDTGIAYRTKLPRFKISPDFSSGQFVKGYDFVGNDKLPLDENGHGTHVAGTIAEKTNNGIGLAGLAFRAKLMPVRVLDAHGRGRADEIAKGIRFAVANGADVINMSFNFGCGRHVPVIDEALRQAYKHGVVAVASVGNLGSEACVSPPSTSPHVIGVGGSTEGGCLGGYSLSGRDVDLIAPGGGPAVAGCPSISSGSIYQVTLKGSSTRIFAEPANYVGTSMSAAHVSGVAAMVLASDTVNRKHRPARVKAVTRRLRATARDLGQPANRQGAGLIDAGAATLPAS